MRRTAPQAAFTLVELLVVIAIIGTLVALLLPAVQSARETARGNTCRNNLKQLALAMTNYDSTQRKLPGLVNEIPNRSGGKNSNDEYLAGRRASWTVMLLPYIEQSPLWDLWSQNFTLVTTDQLAALTPSLENLACPSDPPETPGTPATSYVANAGRAFLDSTRTAAERNLEYAPNGAFFDLNKKQRSNPTGGGWPNVSDGREGSLALQSSINYVQGADGTSKTMMVTENLHAVWYTYPFAEPANPVIAPNDVPDAKHHFGFVWQNTPQTGASYNAGGETVTLTAANQRINGARLLPTVDNLGSMIEGLAFPSSNHPQSVNFAFFDGRVLSVSESVDDGVYAQMMTTKYKRSQYKRNNVLDRNLPQPTESDLNP